MCQAHDGLEPFEGAVAVPVCSPSPATLIVRNNVVTQVGRRMNGLIPG
jgi:hypothetical protein